MVLLTVLFSTYGPNTKKSQDFFLKSWAKINNPLHTCWFKLHTNLEPILTTKYIRVL